MSPKGKDRDLRELQRIVAGKFDFPNDLLVSPFSKFGDWLWTWFDPEDKRLRYYTPDRLTIDWRKMMTRSKIPERIVIDLKRYAFVRYAHSREVFGLRRGNRNGHPTTIVNEIRVMCGFLARLCQDACVEEYSVIQQLSDIVVEDLERVLVSSTAHGHVLKKVLAYLALPGMAKIILYGPVGWNYCDVKALPWRMKKRTSYERLPEPLFQFLSSVATSDVRQFLEALNMQTEDKTKIIRENNIFLSEFPSFHEVFEDYVEMRSVVRAQREKGDPSLNMYSVWCYKHQNRIREFSNLIDRAVKAAELIVTMYTGARLSELNSFTTDSLMLDGGEWILLGTELKRRSRWAPTFRDKWVAIPIVRDAVHLLTQTARLVHDKHLFHHRRLARTARRLGSAEHRKHLMGYLKTIDISDEWSHVDLHPMRFRHSLVYELRKGGLGIPYITFQLKHYHDSLNAHPSNVTIMYGNLGGTASRKAVEDANREFIEQLYHPESVVAGGGAKQHEARRAAFFNGVVLNGSSVDDVISELAVRGAPLVDVGTAMCTGQRVIVVDGVKKDPPCIGGLRCNPVRCENALIPEFKQSAWKRARAENLKRLADPAYSHARSYLEEAVAEADAVINFIQIQGRQ
jgi:hypothetical protein